MRRMIIPINKLARDIKIESADFTAAKGHLEFDLKGDGFYKVYIRENLAEMQHLEITFSNAVMLEIDETLDTGLHGMEVVGYNKVRDSAVPSVRFDLPANHQVNTNVLFIYISNGIARISLVDAR